MPTFTILVERNWINCFTDELTDRARPEILRLSIPAYHSHFPCSWKLFPDLVRHLLSNAEPAIAAKDEEFRHIPNTLIARHLRSPAHKDKAGPMTINHSEKWMPIGFFPVQGKMRVPKTPICAKFQTKELAEIMCIQLKQISQYRLLLG